MLVCYPEAGGQFGGLSGGRCWVARLSNLSRICLEVNGIVQSPGIRWGREVCLDFVVRVTAAKAEQTV